MAHVGVFGAMGSGKSTVSRWFRERGAALVEGDALGWETLGQRDVASALVKEFGPSIADGAGDIDRRALGRMVFASPEAMARLNAIVQPPLLVRVRAALRAAAARIVVLDAALLTTWGLEGELDGVIEVVAPEAVRVDRVRRARALSREEALERIRGQSLPAPRNPRRHWIIQNDGDLGALRRRAESVWDEIAALP